MCVVIQFKFLFKRKLMLSINEHKNFTERLKFLLCLKSVDTFLYTVLCITNMQIILNIKKNLYIYSLLVYWRTLIM